MHYNTFIVLLGSSILGMSGGLIGCFLLLKKRVLISDTVSHATLPGVGIAFIVMELLGMQKSLPGLLLGASISSVIAILALSGIRRLSKTKEDALLAIVLACFFGLGTVILSIVQRMPHGSAAGLNSFIYGKTASMLASDALLIIVMSFCILIVLIAIYKELNLSCFDPEWAQAGGYQIHVLDFILSMLALLLIIVGLQAVGLILMVAVIVLPPTAARFWTNTIHIMSLLAAFFGILGGAFGTLISAVLPNSPAGAVIVLSMGTIFIVSVIFGKEGGILVQSWRHHRIATEITRERFFLNCYYALLPLSVEECIAYVTDKGYPADKLTPRRFKLKYGELIHSEKSWRLSALIKLYLYRGIIRRVDGQYQLSSLGLAYTIQQARNHERRHALLRHNPSAAARLPSYNTKVELSASLEDELHYCHKELFDPRLDILAGEL